MRRSPAALQTLRYLKQFLRVRQLSRRVSAGVLDHALAVDHETRPARDPALLVVDPIRLRHRPLGVEICEQLEVNTAVGLRKRLLRCERVNTYVEYLYTGGLVVVLVLTEPFELIRSATGEAERVKYKDNRVASKFAQLDGLVLLRRPCEVRRCGT